MKIFEICFFKEGRTERVIKQVHANSEDEAIKTAEHTKKDILSRQDWEQFVEITASFHSFVNDHLFKHASHFNQMVDTEAYASSRG